jgi:hypothetical protein
MTNLNTGIGGGEQREWFHVCMSLQHDSGNRKAFYSALPWRPFIFCLLQQGLHRFFNFFSSVPGRGPIRDSVNVGFPNFQTGACLILVVSGYSRFLVL